MPWLAQGLLKRLVGRAFHLLRLLSTHVWYYQCPIFFSDVSCSFALGRLSCSPSPAVALRTLASYSCLCSVGTYRYPWVDTRFDENPRWIFMICLQLFPRQSSLWALDCAAMCPGLQPAAYLSSYIHKQDAHAFYA